MFHCAECGYVSKHRAEFERQGDVWVCYGGCPPIESLEIVEEDQYAEE